VTASGPILTVSESAERQPVAPRAGTLGRVGSNEEPVVDVQLEPVDHQSRARGVLGGHLLTDARLRTAAGPTAAPRSRSVTVPYLRTPYHTTV